MTPGLADTTEKDDMTMLTIITVAATPITVI